MTTEAGFNSPEEMQQAYDQMWEDIAGFLGDVPGYISEAADFTVTNPAALMIVSLVIVFIAFLLIRSLISVFSGRNR